MAEHLKALHDDAYVEEFLALEGKSRVDRILARIAIPADAKVLDVGCGQGALLTKLHDRIGEYHGVDFAEPFIRAARERARAAGLTHCHFHLGDITEFARLHPGEFDLAFALDISEHVPDDEWAAIVSSLQIALKPGGCVVCHTPNLDFFIERMKDRNFLIRQFPQHVAVRTLEQNAAFFERAGFSNVSASTLPHYNFLRILDPLSRLPGLGRHFAARVLIVASK
jgi:2-polyprenyl-3-methyl-5-hydroxy-6-metoxy-1,4-benzoquinol methylase